MIEYATWLVGFFALGFALGFIAYVVKRGFEFIS